MVTLAQAASCHELFRQYCVFVLDIVVSKGMSVRQFKEQLLKEVSLQGLPFELNIER